MIVVYLEVLMVLSLVLTYVSSPLVGMEGVGSGMPDTTF